MTQANIDPAPRSYPHFVSLLRRGHFDPGTVAGADQAGVAAWLLSGAADENDLLELFQSFVWRLVAAGLPLDRASLHVGTLHPQLFGYAWNWNREDRFCDEVKVDETALKTDAYRLNPLFRVIEFGERFRARLHDRDSLRGSPLLAELAGQGISEYVAVPLPAGGGFHNAMSVATKQAGGFSEKQAGELARCVQLFGLHVQRHISDRVSRNVVHTYLGAGAGDQVLRGAIKRGSGAQIDAVIWASDLRGFTDLADRLSDTDMLAVLNAYFDRMAGSVMAEGGEVLKFIGDGLLAVFPFSQFESERAAAAAGLNAAQNALGALDRLNSDGTDLAHIANWRPLRSGIALHRGKVFFGNVGAPERLDFTVIGRAVNAASRVESLSKSLGRPLLITQAVADLLDHVLDDLGRHHLRGLSEPIGIFAPAELSAEALSPAPGPRPSGSE